MVEVTDESRYIVLHSFVQLQSANSVFPLHQTGHEPARSIFLSQQISTSHGQPKRYDALWLGYRSLWLGYRLAELAQGRDDDSHQ